MRPERDPTPYELVVELLVEAGAARRATGPEERLADLGMDSLAVADVALAIEEQLGVRLPAVEDGAVYTVGDIVGAIEHPAQAGPRVPPRFGTWRGWVRPLGAAVVRPYTALEVLGAEHVALDGPLILAPNHRSMLDIPVLVVAAPRKVTFMAKQELYVNRPLSLLWRKLGGFPVRREVADLRAMDTALALLERGEAVAVYPEGTRNRGGREPLLPFLQGAAWLALRTGVTIVPCGVRGTGLRAPLWKRRHVRVAFGRPVPVEREDDLGIRRKKQEVLTDELAAAVAGLLL